jgi:hypothetical protein
MVHSSGIDTVTPSPIKLTAGQVQEITRPCASLVHEVLRGELANPLLVRLASSPLWLLGVLAASLAYQPLQPSKHPASWRCQPPQELQHCLPFLPCQPAAATLNRVLNRRMSYNLFMLGENYGLQTETASCQVRRLASQQHDGLYCKHSAAQAIKGCPIVC